MSIAQRMVLVFGGILALSMSVGLWIAHLASISNPLPWILLAIGCVLLFLVTPQAPRSYWILTAVAVIMFLILLFVLRSMGT